ncbi:hypothetical protein [Ferrovibrio terrae]|uniref:hypothetical protein n=1 Tax=Ferrovibrio terrae TaxID=2594003 RepID=UPI003138166D
MTRVHILSDDFASPNGLAFLYPVVLHRRLLRDAGLTVRLFAAADEALTDCDVLIVDSKAFRDQWADSQTRQTALSRIAVWAGKTAVLFFDTTDSTGWVNAAVLPLVQGYYKNQALRDRSLYATPLYGGRLHTDYTHRVQGIADEQPSPPWPTVAPTDATKIRIGWNSSLADYSFMGLYRAHLFRRLHWSALLSPTQRYSSPSARRSLAVSCRMSTAYSRATVSWQRQQVKQLLGDRVATNRLSRHGYFKELERSRIVISPFGFGEINYRDYESFISGALLLKPDMSHMETWPDIFRVGETILTHRWDCSDLLEQLEEALVDYDQVVEIAHQGQAVYRHFVSSRAGHEAFASRFHAIVTRAL